MDFVKGLGDASHLQDVLVDDIGRVEVFCGRMRITLCRVIEDGEGHRHYAPVVPLVYTITGWRNARNRVPAMRALVEGGDWPEVPGPDSPLHH